MQNLLVWLWIEKLWGVRGDWPAGKTTPSVGLELDDDVGQLEVSFFLQVRQNTGTEEDLALTDTIKVLVKLQRLNLKGQKISLWPIKIQWTHTRTQAHTHTEARLLLTVEC